MNILEVRTLAFPEIKVIRATKHRDHRGYFFESFRISDAQRGADFLAGRQFVQANASFSRAGTVRGVHFQWDPPMGKLVRTVHGRMIDIVLDVRPASATYGQMLACDLSANEEWSDVIWIPPGFAHGNVFPTDCYVEYLCTSEYNPRGETGISPLAADIDWSLVDGALAQEIRDIISREPLMTDKDRNALTLDAWARDPRGSSPAFSTATRI